MFSSHVELSSATVIAPAVCFLQFYRWSKSLQMLAVMLSRGPRIRRFCHGMYSAGRSFCIFSTQSGVVCRQTRMTVHDEAAAEQADAMVRKWKMEVMDTVPGFIGITRRVCREHWDYELDSCFESQE